MTSYTTRSSYPYPDPSDQVADYPTTASAIAGYLDHLPNRNAIINPVMDIWQRGTSFSNPATGTYTADRWRIDYDGTGGTRTVARNNISLGTNLPSGIQGKYFMEVTLTNAGTATTQSISQRVEGVRTFAGETITLSAWVRNDGGGTGVNTLTATVIQNFGTGGSPSTAVTTVLGTAAVTGTWVRLHVHATLPSISGKTIGSNGDDYLQIMFNLGSQTGKFWLYGVQLEQNTTQTAFERRPLQEEIALCQRYYYRRVTETIYGHIGLGVVQSLTTAVAFLNFPVTMRAIPTLDNYANLRIYDAGVGPAVTSLGVSAAGSNVNAAELSLVASGGGMTLGRVAVLQGNNNAAGYLGLTAEL